MSRASILLVLGVFWAVMMTALVRRELVPYLDYQAPPTYRTLLWSRSEPFLIHRRVFYGVRPVGEMDTMTVPRADGTYQILNRTTMDLRELPGSAGVPPAMAEMRMDLTSEIRVGSDFRLSEFRLHTRSLGLAIEVKGVREGKGLRVTYRFPFAKGEEWMEDFPDDTVLSDDQLPFPGGGKLTIGKKWKTTTARPNPLGKQKLVFEDAYAEVIDREAFYWKEEMVDAYRVQIRKTPDPDHSRTPDFDLYVDPSGRILEQRMKYSGQQLRVVLEEERTLTAEEVRRKNEEFGVPNPEEEDGE